MTYHVFEIVRLALRCLAANLLRSLLTLLGIIIGVASVIFMMSVTAGARSEILREMEQLGLQNIIINSVEPTSDETTTSQPSYIQRYGLLNKDMEQIRNSCKDIESMNLAHEVREEAWLGARKVGARILAVEPAYFATLGLHSSLGRTVSDLDDSGRKHVCNVGTQLLDQYSIVQDPMTVRFKIADLIFEVVGIIDQPRYTSHNLKVLATSPKLLNLYMPAQTALQHFGTTSTFRREGAEGGVTVDVDQAIIRVQSGRPVLPTADAIRQILQDNHPRRDYDLIVPLELLQQKARAQRVFGITMILIASISLIVGGIGIINIMLATVTERTREIGIRRACGAKRRHIAYQFLVETTTLSLLGGVIGCLLGIGGVFTIAPQIGWTAIVTTESIVLALGISCAVGILFGTWPALKASRMDPIEALRFE